MNFRFLFTLLFFLPHFSQASITLKNVKPLVSLAVGDAIARLPQGQVLNMPNDYTTYSYQTRSSFTEQVTWGIWGGGQFVALNNLEIGLGYYHPNMFSVNGNVVQGVDPASSDQFKYTYRINSQQLLVEGKFLQNYRDYYPYISLGLGAAFNRAYGYKTSVPLFLTFTPEFTPHTTTSFSYTLGLGVDKQISPHWRMGLGYRFADYGQVGLGNGLVDETLFTKALSQSHFYIQTVLVQLTYSFS